MIPLMTLKGGGLEIVEVKIPPDALVVGRPVKTLLLPQKSLITLIIGSDGQARLPTADTIIQSGDEVVAVTTTDSEDALRSALTGVLAPQRY